MAYSKQTFSLNQVLTATQMNQVEDNISDHVHGEDGVAGGAGFTMQTFTADGTWTKPSGLSAILVYVVGAGGGGGGCNGNNEVAAGGGSGGVSYKVIADADLAATETVLVGSGGAAGNAGAGGDGSATTFGSFLSANGGTGGGDAGALNAGGAGATATSSGDINLAGQRGLSGHNAVAGTANIDYMARAMGLGEGGATPLGFGLPGRVRDNTTPDAGVGYGAGGSGNARRTSGTTGQAGSDGFVQVFEYYG